jgi:DNA polymerase III delta prime subunit
MTANIILPKFDRNPIICNDIEDNFINYNLQFHKREISILDTIAKKTLNMDLLFVGQSGSGRLTLVKYFLKKLFGNKVFTSLTPINKENEDTNSIKSEILANNKMFYVSQFVPTTHLIKFLESIKNQETSENHFRPIVILDLENHKNNFHNILCSFIESRQGHYPIIGIYNSNTNIPSRLQSYFIQIKIPRPTNTEMIEIINVISKQRNLTITDKQIERIIEHGVGDLTSTLYYLDLTTTETHKYQKYNYYYRDLSKEIVAIIVNPLKTLDDLFILRKYLHEIYLSVSDKQFLEWILLFIQRCKLEESYLNKIMELTAETDLQLQESRVQYYCLENYIFKLFEII